MPGRLKSKIHVWRQTTSDSFVLSVIDGGYKISWNEYGVPPPRERVILQIVLITWNLLIYPSGMLLLWVSSAKLRVKVFIISLL